MSPGLQREESCQCWRTVLSWKIVILENSVFCSLTGCITDGFDFALEALSYDHGESKELLATSSHSESYFIISNNA